PFGPKERDHVRAVGGHGAIGVRGLGMALLLRHAFMRGFIPKNFARLLVQAKDFPLLDVIVLVRRRVSIKPDLKTRGLALVAGGSHKQPVSPNDRAGVAEARNR